MITDIALYQSGSVQLNTLSEVQVLAQIVVQSKLFGITSAADAVIRMLTGGELGLTPLQSLRTIYVMNGRPVLSADLMQGVVKSKVAICKYFRLVESTDVIATYETLRVGEPEPVRMSYTIQQAKVAGLAGKGTWQSHPAAMLRARASAILARAVYPDVLGGMYLPDEAEEIKPKPVREVKQAEVIQLPEPAWEDTFKGFANRMAKVATAAELEEVVADIKASDLPEEALRQLRDIYDGIHAGVA